jgi:thioredoxin 1
MLMAGNIVEVNDSTFQDEVLNATVPVVVDFWAPWCGPCRALAPIIEQLSTKAAGKAKVCKVNVDDAKTTAMNYVINAIPTVLIFKDGQLAKRNVGLTSLADLEKMIADLG